MELKELLFENFAKEFPTIFNKGWEKKPVCKLSDKAARKSKTSKLPVDMFLFTAGNFNVTNQKEGLCSLLVEDGCDGYIKYFIEKNTDICNALNHIDLIESDCSVLHSIICNLLWKNGYIVEAIKIQKIILHKCKRYSNLCETLDYFYSDIAIWGKVVNTSEIQSLNKLSTNQRIRYYKNANKLFIENQELFDLMKTICPHTPLIIPTNVPLKGRTLREHLNDWGNTRYIYNNFNYNTLKILIQLYQSDNYNSSIRKMISEFIAANVNKLIHIYEYKDKIPEICENKLITSIIISKKDYYTELLSVIATYALLHFKDDILLNILDSYSNNTMSSEFLENLYQKLGEIHSFDYTLNEDSYYKFQHSFITIKEKLPNFNYDIAIQRSNFVKTLHLIENDLSITIPQKIELINKIEKGTMWANAKDFPSSIVLIFKYPNGKQGDVYMYLCEKYGNVTKVDILTYQATINSTFRDKIIHLLCYLSNNVIIPENVLNSFLPYLLNNLHYNCSETYQFNIYKETEKRKMIILNRFRNETNTLYAQILSENKSTPKWKSEFQLYTITKKYFPDSIYQYRSVWLDSQSLDIFIPSISVAIEYQGIQHYKSVDFFGGEDSLSNRISLDEKKKRLCNDNQITLIEWHYSIEITENNFKKIMKKYGFII